MIWIVVMNELGWRVLEYPSSKPLHVIRTNMIKMRRQYPEGYRVFTEHE